jgi:hypothetical protein
MYSFGCGARDVERVGTGYGVIVYRKRRLEGVLIGLGVIENISKDRGGVGQ